MVKGSGREFHGLSNLFLFFLDLNYFAAFVMPAARANAVRQPHLSTIRANDQVVACQGIVRTSPVATARRMFPFRLWGHDPTPVSAPSLDHPG
jgi:hypothetical protein